MRTECPFSFVCVLLQESVVIIVVNSGTFLSRFLIVALPCRHWRSKVSHRSSGTVSFSCVCSPVWRYKVLDPVDEGIKNILHCVGWNPTIGIHHKGMESKVEPAAVSCILVCLVCLSAECCCQWSGVWTTHLWEGVCYWDVNCKTGAPSCQVVDDEVWASLVLLAIVVSLPKRRYFNITWSSAAL